MLRSSESEEAPWPKSTPIRRVAAVWFIDAEGKKVAKAAAVFSKHDNGDFQKALADLGATKRPTTGSLRASARTYCVDTCLDHLALASMLMRRLEQAGFKA